MQQEQTSWRKGLYRELETFTKIKLSRKAEMMQEGTDSKRSPSLPSASGWLGN